MRLDRWNVYGLIWFKVFNFYLILGVNIVALRYFVKLPKIDYRDRQMSVNAFRYSTHFRVTMPVKFLPFWNNYVEESKFGLSFDGQSNNAVRRHDFAHNFDEFRYLYLVDFFYQETIMRGVDEWLREEIVVFGYDIPDEIENVFKRRGLLEH